MFCNDAILEKYNIKVPTTWDEFTKAAADLHKADKNVYLGNFTPDQGWFFGMLWQSGAKPFTVDGTNIKIDFTSPEVTRVAKLWDELMKSGNLAPVDTYSNDWNTAIGNGTIACWQAGAWGTYISGYGPDFKGKWKVYLMPQWKAGDKVNGNYGGSTIAVTKASAHPKEAAEFAKWLNTDAKATLDLTNPDKAGLFPVTQATLSNKAWSDVPYDYWSGQPIHQVMADYPTVLWSRLGCTNVHPTIYFHGVGNDDFCPEALCEAAGCTAVAHQRVVEVRRLRPTRPAPIAAAFISRMIVSHRRHPGKKPTSFCIPGKESPRTSRSSGRCQ